MSLNVYNFVMACHCVMKGYCNDKYVAVYVNCDCTFISIISTSDHKMRCREVGE